jgi:hypothetical protein
MNMRDPLSSNSATPDYGYLQPTMSKRLPFPLENTEEGLIAAAESLESVRRKLIHSKEYNGLNTDGPRLRHINKMIYKANTIMSLMRALAKDLDEMYL